MTARNVSFSVKQAGIRLFSLSLIKGKAKYVQIIECLYLKFLESIAHWVKPSLIYLGSCKTLNTPSRPICFNVWYAPTHQFEGFGVLGDKRKVSLSLAYEEIS